MSEAAMVAAAVVQVPTDIDGLPTAAERDAMVDDGEGVSR
jgi:hypothetical protein